tara:strand:- start:4287 stop:4799 length:513 start_codon:yes stop_codon:yes gene_type:complete
MNVENIQEETNKVVSDLRSKLNTISPDSELDHSLPPGLELIDENVSFVDHVDVVELHDGPDHERHRGNSEIPSQNKNTHTRHTMDKEILIDKPNRKNDWGFSEEMKLTRVNREFLDRETRFKSQPHPVHIHMRDITTYNIYPPPKKSTKIPRLLCNLICDGSDDDCFCEI